MTLGCGALVGPVGADQTSETLAAAKKAITGIQSFTATVELVTARTPMRGIISARRPASVRLEVDNTPVGLLVSDGKTAWVYNRDRKQYLSRPLSGDSARLASNPIFSVAPQLRAFFNPEVFFRFPPGAKTRHAGKKKLDGVLCDVIEAEYVRGNAASPAMAKPAVRGTFWFTAKEHMIVRIESRDLTDLSKPPVVATLKNLRLNPKLPASTFVWTPPPGSRPAPPRAATAPGPAPGGVSTMTLKPGTRK